MFGVESRGAGVGERAVERRELCAHRRMVWLVRAREVAHDQREIEVVQGSNVLRLKTHQDAVDWNAGLPCSGLITSIHSHGQIVTATFRLADRPKSRCDGPGKRVTAIFRVVDGKIVLWHQTVREGPEGPSV